MNQDALKQALTKATDHLLTMRNSSGYWEGHLSSSALSTAVAVTALVLADNRSDEALISGGVEWLGQTQNTDGGWGDTPDSPSNLSTTLLALSSIRLAKQTFTGSEQMITAATAYGSSHAGSSSETIVKSVQAVYGEDRTFAVPILAVCALSGIVEWSQVPELPFELALLPASMYKIAKLQVVSYAMPALIGVGLLIANKNKAGGLKKGFRESITPRLLTKLGTLQPENGGFLEAAPLTGFVAASLAACGFNDSPVLAKCLDFLRASVREDGSWPIDTNLSVWVTSNAVSALKEAEIESPGSIEWISKLQHTRIHPFTGAAPGGWGWTHLPGGVPDADDTAGAIRVLVSSGNTTGISDGVQWLLDLQNSDGGLPTFCRGWGKLPFDQSSPDITAHALRALTASKGICDPDKISMSIRKGIKYLENTQRSDGSWVPLWFGCQTAPKHENPVYGTGRVLQALIELDIPKIAESAIDYLVGAANSDGGWGGAVGSPSTIEETAVAVMGLSGYTRHDNASQAVINGAEYLIRRVEHGTWLQSSPIGLYFASLWYSEDTYPVSWTVEALARVLNNRQD
jgi:squalene-hopene/tetraprenyl-beta-curcumene cyclase